MKESEIKRQIVARRAKRKEPKYLLMGIKQYESLCCQLGCIFVKEYPGLKIIVSRSDILEVVLEPHETYLALA